MDEIKIFRYEIHAISVCFSGENAISDIISMVLEHQIKRMKETDDSKSNNKNK